YRNEKGVAANSQVETFAAVRLLINSWRWQGVPFFIRAGKCLPVTCTEAIVRLRRPPQLFDQAMTWPNYIRFRVGPEMMLALGANVMGPGEENVGAEVELLASHHPVPEDMDAYERLLGEAMHGDASLFAREDSVEAAWRIVDPIVGDAVPVFEYEPGTWGPK